MTIQRDAKGRYLKGSIPNPAGRPKKEATLTAALREAGNKKRRVGKMTISQRKLLAKLIWQAATEGKIKFPKGQTLEVISIKDWFTIISWLYDRVDGKATENIQINEPEAEITAEDLTVAMAELEKWKKDRGA